jgi:class 3 adenylate cyclase
LVDKERCRVVIYRASASRKSGRLSSASDNQVNRGKTVTKYRPISIGAGTQTEKLMLKQKKRKSGDPRLLSKMAADILDVMKRFESANFPRYL